MTLTIDCIERYRAQLKDSKTGNFVESIIGVLSEETLIDFFFRSLKRFNVNGEVYITTDGYHYSSVLREVSRILGIRMSRQRCLFHIENDLAHRIKDLGRENNLNMAKKLINFMFFPDEENLNKL